MTPEFPNKEELENDFAPMTEEGTMTIKEEAIATLEFSGQVELGTASALTTKEATATPKFLSKDEQGTMTTPKY